MMASSSASLLRYLIRNGPIPFQPWPSVGETIAGITGMYITMFIAIPMTDKLYTILEPKLGRFALKNKEGRDIKEETV